MKWIVILALAGCTSSEVSPWPDKGDPGPVPDDPRLGTRIEGFVNLFQFHVTETHAFAIGRTDYSDPGRLYEIDISGAVPTLHGQPEPPVAFGSALPGVSLVDGTFATSRAFFDGTTWTEIPEDSESHPTYLAIARSASQVIIGLEDDGLPETVGRYWNGTTWQTLVLPGVTSSAIGPWDDSGLRVLWSDTSNHVCTAVMDLSTLAVGASICSSFQGVYDVQHAFNGTVDDFFTQGQGTVAHFDGNAFTPGPSFDKNFGFMTNTPGQAAVLRVSIDAFSTPHFTNLTNGQTLLPSFPAELSCTCDRATDAMCSCVPRPLLAELVPWPGKQTVLMVTSDEVDGRRALYIRALDVPASESPLFEYP